MRRDPRKIKIKSCNVHTPYFKQLWWCFQPFLSKLSSWTSLSLSFSYIPLC